MAKSKWMSRVNGTARQKGNPFRIMPSSQKLKSMLPKSKGRLSSRTARKVFTEQHSDLDFNLAKIEQAENAKVIYLKNKNHIHQSDLTTAFKNAYALREKGYKTAVIKDSSGNVEIWTNAPKNVNLKIPAKNKELTEIYTGKSVWIKAKTGEEMPTVPVKGKITITSKTSPVKGIQVPVNLVGNEIPRFWKKYRKYRNTHDKGEAWFLAKNEVVLERHVDWKSRFR